MRDPGWRPTQMCVGIFLLLFHLNLSEIYQSSPSDMASFSVLAATRSRQFSTGIKFSFRSAAPDSTCRRFHCSTPFASARRRRSYGSNSGPSLCASRWTFVHLLTSPSIFLFFIFRGFDTLRFRFAPVALFFLPDSSNSSCSSNNVLWVTSHSMSSESLSSVDWFTVAGTLHVISCFGFCFFGQILTEDVDELALFFTDAIRGPKDSALRFVCFRKYFL
mmetsp:Transcript_32356/g.78719  ORF Transcript_32356/g.78719 Transcript_32356/m.78719 type:complete len:219 (+) Transcript_32356:2759-3415(+)